MRRPINTKLKVYWSRVEQEYMAIVGLLPGVLGRGNTVEKALLDLSTNMREHLEMVILNGNNV